MDLQWIDYRKTPIEPELIAEEILSRNSYEAIYDLSNKMGELRVEVRIKLYLKLVGGLSHCATMNLTEPQYDVIKPILKTIKEL